VLAATAMLAATDALACAEMIEVALTPERHAVYERMLERARADLAAAQREVDGIRQRLGNPSLDAAARAELARREKDWEIEIGFLKTAGSQAQRVLDSGREQTYRGAAARPGEPAPRCR
jgi:hypothetical protein